MMTFEVLLNGNPLYTYTMDAGEFGMLSASIVFLRDEDDLGAVVEEYLVSPLATNGPQSQRHPNTNLKLGDEITVRLVENDRQDSRPPSQNR